MQGMIDPVHMVGKLCLVFDSLSVCSAENLGGDVRIRATRYRKEKESM
jgi:hypothetical protein